MTSYFKKCRTAEELKKEYRHIAKRLHPDLGGEKEAFQAMQLEFENAWEKLKNVHVNRKGDFYEKATEETASEFIDIIEELLKLRGVETEICGNWIWCSGETKPHKEKLKEMGFKFSHKKSAWYWHRDGYKRWHDREYSMDEIRSMYGSQKYTRDKEEKEKEKRLVLQP